MMEEKRRQVGKQLRLTILILSTFFSSCTYTQNETERKLLDAIEKKVSFVKVDFPEYNNKYKLVCILTPYQSRIKGNKDFLLIEKANEMLTKDQFYGSEGYSTLMFISEDSIYKVNLHWNTLKVVNTDSIYKNATSLSGKKYQDCVDSKNVGFGIFSSEKNENVFGLINLNSDL